VTKALFFATQVVFLAGAQDATYIIRRSVERDAYNFERFKNYTFLERVEERRYGRSGDLSSKEIQTYEFMISLCPPRKPAGSRKSWTRNRPSGSASLRPIEPNRIGIARRNAVTCAKFPRRSF